MARAETDILAQVMSAPPVDTTYVAGRWHHDRATLYGYWIEARVLASMLLQRQPGAENRFLIIGRARSGTTLLTDLLNAHLAVQCDREVLHFALARPAAHLERLAAKCPCGTYGAKLLSYQMVQVHRMADPRGFLAGLAGRGWRLIHLERDTFAQTLSLHKAQGSGRYHSDQGTRAKPSGPLVLEPEDFARRLEWNDLLLRYEHWCLQDLTHLHVSYDRDLATAEQQSAAMARIFDWIGVPDAPVQTTLEKVLPPDPTRLIANFDAVADAVRARGLGHLLPALSPA